MTLSAMVIFTYLCMSFFFLSDGWLPLKDYAGKVDVNEVWTFIGLVSLTFAMVASAMRKTKRYFSTTDLKEVQTQFNHIYYIWIPALSGAFSILFYFEGGLDVFVFYILMGLHFFIIALYFTSFEEKQKDKRSNLLDIIQREFIVFQFIIQTWFFFLLIHFWQNQKWGFLGLQIVFGVGLVMFWVKPGNLVLNHTLALRLFLYAFGLFVVWISWRDFDLAHQIFSINTRIILMKLMGDFIIAYIYLNTMSPKGMEKIIDYCRE